MKNKLYLKYFKKIVETEPDKMENINDEVKDVMIKQTVESAKNQKKEQEYKKTRTLQTLFLKL